MIKMQLSIWVLCLFPLFATAQYQKGTIEFTSGERLAGYIQRDGDFDLQKKVYFKTSPEEDSPQIFSPLDARTFSFEGGDSFEAITITRLENGVDLQERVFAKVLARGAIDLYFVQTNVAQDKFDFYARKDDSLHRLTRDPVLQSSGKYSQRDPYRGGLKVLTFDCKQAIGNLDKLKFTQKEILAVINAYNACRDETYRPMIDHHYLKVTKERQYFGEAFTGITFNRPFDEPKNATTDRIIVGIAGIALQRDSKIPTLSRKLVIHNSLGVYRFFSIKGGKTDVFIEGEPPSASLVGTVMAHYLLTPDARLKWFTSLGVTATLDFGTQAPLRSGVSFGMGTYLPSGSRITLRLEGYWRLGFAFPLSKIRMNRTWAIYLFIIFL